MKLQIFKTSSGRVGGFSHCSRWQQLTAAARGSRSRQQMATAHGTVRGSRWQQIACWVSVSAADFVSAESNFMSLVSAALTADWFYSVGFKPTRSQPDRVGSSSSDRVAITTRSDPNPTFFGSDRVGSDRVGKIPKDLSSIWVVCKRLIYLHRVLLAAASSPSPQLRARLPSPSLATTPDLLGGRYSLLGGVACWSSSPSSLSTSLSMFGR
ncbi:hypothetical protein WN943_008100 [Citrus x changshan-huyou]